MPRKGPAPKRPVVQDPVYGSPVVSQLINKILLHGKKSLAESIVYGALEGTNRKTGDDPVVILKKALLTPWQCVGWFSIQSFVVRRP
jgi:small subunit ribosomal protein S7